LPEKGAIEATDHMAGTEEQPINIPVNGVLDLHTFSPRDVPSVVEEYIRVCLEKGIYEVRIVHGKGKGVLRRTVHALLERHPNVVRYKIDTGPSSWGATAVWLEE
jgi:DNA-nicking Smr family endonuclease